MNLSWTLPRNHASPLAVGVLVLAVTGAQAGDYIDAAQRVTVATSRCAAFGPGFVDMGNGTCARISSHIRVQFGLGRVGNEPGLGAWGTGGTSSATLRSEGSELMPGVGESHQLRVRHALQSLSPY